MATAAFRQEIRVLDTMGCGMKVVGLRFSNFRISLNRNIESVREALDEGTHILAISHANNGSAFRAMNSKHFEIAILRFDK